VTVRRVAYYKPEKKHKCALPDPSTFQWQWNVLQCNGCERYYWSKPKRFLNRLNKFLYERPLLEFKWVGVAWDEDAKKPPESTPSGGFSPM